MLSEVDTERVGHPLAGAPGRGRGLCHHVTTARDLLSAVLVFK